MRRGRLTEYLRFTSPGRPEEYREDKSRDDRCDARNQEERLEVDDAGRSAVAAKQFRPQSIGHERAKAKDHQVKQSLRAGAGIFWEELVHENVNRGEKECVADAVENIDGHNEALMLREKRE